MTASAAYRSRMNVNAIEPAHGALNHAELCKAITFAVTRASGDHSILYIHVSGYSEYGPAATRKTLCRLTCTLGAQFKWASTDTKDFVVFLEARTREHAMQVARLVRTVIRRETRPRCAELSLRLLAIACDESDVGALLKRARSQWNKLPPRENTGEQQCRQLARFD